MINSRRTFRSIFRSALAALLMLALPLQGLAAFAPATPCGEEHATMLGSATQHAAADAHSGKHDMPEGHDHAAAGSHGHHAPDNNMPAQDISFGSGHNCCHHVFTGVPPVAAPTPPEAPNAVMPRVSLLATLFIPELPQRPPRA
ncbi:MAG: hypothetical protein K2W84_12220 [Burkholderiales bacterium]|nr:hypothetical protein [Burkholderiales bacterium]